MAQTVKRPDLILWGAGTPRTLRAYWALHELRLAYETRPIASRSGETRMPEYKQLNPKEQIPALQDGDITVTESAAIVTYLCETYGEPLGLIPPVATPERAAYYEWSFFTMMELDALSLYTCEGMVAWLTNMVRRRMPCALPARASLNRSRSRTASWRFKDRSFWAVRSSAPTFCSRVALFGLIDTTYP
jgi:hypothetical protein